MTTTPEPKTPEQIFKDAWHAADERGEEGGRVAAGLAALRAAGLLVDAPTEEQIARGARAIYDTERAASPVGQHWITWEQLIEKDREHPERGEKYGAEKYRRLARAAYMAGAAPQPNWDALQDALYGLIPVNVQGEKAFELSSEMVQAIKAYCAPTAAGVAPQEPSEPAPSPDREKLSRLVEAYANAARMTGQVEESDSLYEAADALAAQPAVDEAKLAEVKRKAAAKALEGAAEAFDMATINVTIFGDSAESRAWQTSNDTRARMVASLRARAAEIRGGGR